MSPRFHSPIRRAFFVLIAVALCSCGSGSYQNQVTAEAPQGQKTDDNIRLGDEAMQRWYDSYDVDSISTAEYYYRLALVEQPDNALLQSAHYEAHYSKEALQQNSDIAAVRQSFNALHPIVKAQYAPPSRLLISEWPNNYRLTDTQRTWAQNALLEQPYRAEIWYQLAQYYYYSEQYWMALAAIEKAVLLAPEDPSYLYEAGLFLDDIAYGYDCVYEHSDLMQKAVQRYSKAAALSGSSDAYLNASWGFSALGIAPLAYNEAQRAYEQEENESTTYALAYSAMSLGNWDQSRELLEKLAEDYSYYYEELAQVSFAQSDIKSAAEYMSLYMHTEYGDGIYNAIVNQWIAELSGVENAQPTTDALATQDFWEDKILRYVYSESTRGINALIDEAKNTCQRTEAHFYMAFRSWKEGNIEEAKSSLQKVMNEKAVDYLEYRWAPIILEVL